MCLCAEWSGDWERGAAVDFSRVGQVLAPAPALASGQAREGVPAVRAVACSAASTVLALASLASSPCFHNWCFASMFFLSSFASFPTFSNWVFDFLLFFGVNRYFEEEKRFE
jgi:hypothetical protein